MQRPRGRERRPERARSVPARRVCQTAPDVPDDLAGWGPPASAPALTPLIIASPGQLVCGPNRVLFTVLDKDGQPAGAPNRTVKVDIFNLGSRPGDADRAVDGTFVWAIKDERGIYFANLTFPEAGRYGAAFTTVDGWRRRSG